MIETQTKKDEPTPIYRKDYRAPSHWIDTVDLTFSVLASECLVRAKMQIRRNDGSDAGDGNLELVGEELELREVLLDGTPLAEDAYRATESRLILVDPPESFLLETLVATHPEKNTQLSGLYASSGNLCTQCEAEGFRRITYFLDRPDVMSRYTVRIEADRETYPVLLSNGNRTGEGDLPDGRHFASWEDPFPKPCYLFALVAGKLECYRDTFTTMSGRTIPLEIWVEPQNIDRCEHAMGSLKKAMKWDEDTFGLEIDLDLYMIFVADDFNMGAMENKGLNVFNSKYVLASPETATDDDYEGIEGVIAHEYFHNWTGNRVTCRDWFQLTLKEGLTVFRDQEFSADMTSAPVKRIQEVRGLRASQFSEDAGPMAHPIRPESYIEMNNFYTATVYSKGAEIIRIYRTLLGRDGFRKGMDLYFERHDGQAVTCDDFRAAMADANAVDLSQMERWYLQAGTPEVRARCHYDSEKHTWTLHLTQKLRHVPGCQEPQPQLLPVRMGLLGKDGKDLPLRLEGEDAAGATTRVLEFTEAEQEFVFVDVLEVPTPSLFRGFSAPIRLLLERSREELAFLMAHDSDPFNRWDAGQELAKRVILELAGRHAAKGALSLDDSLIQAFRRVLMDETLDGSIRSLMMTPPSEAALAQEMDVVDPDALHASRRFFLGALGRGLGAELGLVFEATRPKASESGKQAIDRRRLHNLALALLAATGEDSARALCVEQFESADNMTDYEAAFACLVRTPGAERDAAVASFHERWSTEPLVLDKWFRIQAVSTAADTFDRVLELSEHEDFTLSNPNRMRSLVGSFALANPVHFHRADGRGYRFLADMVLELDRLNPQTASRLVSAFNPWKRFDKARQALMRAELERIAAEDELSRDVGEIVGRALA